MLLLKPLNLFTSFFQAFLVEFHRQIKLDVLFFHLPHKPFNLAPGFRGIQVKFDLRRGFFRFRFYPTLKLIPLLFELLILKLHRDVNINPFGFSLNFGFEFVVKVFRVREDSDIGFTNHVATSQNQPP